MDRRALLLLAKAGRAVQVALAWLSSAHSSESRSPCTRKPHGSYAAEASTESAKSVKVRDRKPHMMVVTIETQRIVDWATFHDVFSEGLGFPVFYGRNMDAWIDCMTCLDDPDAGMSAVHAPAGGVLTLQLENVEDFAARCPIQYAAIIECAAFVNWRRIELGSPPVLALSFNKSN